MGPRESSAAQGTGRLHSQTRRSLAAPTTRLKKAEMQLRKGDRARVCRGHWTPQRGPDPSEAGRGGAAEV